MDYFNYKDGKLFAENTEVSKIASEIGTPVYIYSKATFLEHLEKVKKAYSQVDTTICYSVKACGNINILKLMHQAGSGFDIVSGGELFRVKKAGGDLSKVVYAGVGKTDKEITEAIEAEIGYFNIESEAELENLIHLAQKSQKTVKAALRVNPDVDPETHAYITTGKKESKFGVDIERAKKVFQTYGKNQAVNLCAIHVHLGSGGKTIDPYAQAVKKILPLIDELRTEGFDIEMLDIGGGYGADYESDSVPGPEEYASGIVPLLKGKNLKLVLEPGKSIIANAGILLTRVVYTKQGGSKKFVIVDAGMNDLLRPPLYDAFHFAWLGEVDEKFVPQSRTEQLHIEGTEKVDIVGPICEGADFFAKDRELPPAERGDLVAIFTAGAYGFAMASNYNTRPKPPEILVDGDKYTIIRKRESYQDIINPEE
jgi:diaminopimelate decarboxylase